jgi:hypothetical protein
VRSKDNVVVVVVQCEQVSQLPGEGGGSRLRVSLGSWREFLCLQKPRTDEDANPLLIREDDPCSVASFYFGTLHSDVTWACKVKWHFILCSMFHLYLEPFHIIYHTQTQTANVSHPCSRCCSRLIRGEGGQHPHELENRLTRLSRSVLPVSNCPGLKGLRASAESPRHSPWGIFGRSLP